MVQIQSIRNHGVPIIFLYLTTLVCFVGDKNGIHHTKRRNFIESNMNFGDLEDKPQTAGLMEVAFLQLHGLGALLKHLVHGLIFKIWVPPLPTGV